MPTRATPVPLPGSSNAGPSGQPVPGRSRRSGPARRGDGRAARPWPLILLAVPATIAVWSGWVQLGQMTGFGKVRPLPGLWDSLQINTAITLPIGVEAYGAYALGTWLSSGTRTSKRTRRFAMWSAIGSLVLGMAGQVAYHLMSEARITRAPWAITTAVACLPVLLLGMAAALAHMRHADASGEGHEETRQQPGEMFSRSSGHDYDGHVALRSVPVPAKPGSDGQVLSGDDTSDDADSVETERLEIARVTAVQLTSTGVRVSRRTLRDAGLRGSNAEPGALARAVSAELSRGDDGDQ